MTTDNTFRSARSRIRAIVKAMLVLAIAGLATGCGSTTKVYSPDKSFEYQGSIYNISEVRQLSTRLEGLPSAGSPIDLRGYDKKQFDALVKESGAMTVRSVIALDDQDIVYEQIILQKGSEFSKMQKHLANTYKKLTSFMADARKTQITL